MDDHRDDHGRDDRDDHEAAAVQRLVVLGQGDERPGQREEPGRRDPVTRPDAPREGTRICQLREVRQRPGHCGQPDQRQDRPDQQLEQAGVRSVVDPRDIAVG